ncbi:MAG: response regulator transcription factor [Erysipelotrichaceae bacterium]
MYKILVVEDQEEISSVVIKYLNNNGFETQLVSDGFSALDTFSKDHYHLIILDVMMPGIDGFEVLKRIREISGIPIIMLTAKQSEFDKLEGFHGGADDYVTKPFSVNELIERVKVFIKRVYGDNSEEILVIDEIRLYVNSMKVYKEDTLLDLTAMEFKLLYTLMKYRNHVLDRGQLIELTFGYDYDGYDRNIDSYIKRIRYKIETDPRNPKYLKTKYGQGYQFIGEL